MTWRTAMQDALYGARGFYTRGERPADHFRTSVHVSPAYARAILTLLRALDTSMGTPRRLDLVDVGCGRAELLTQVLRLAAPDLARRLRPYAVELVPRPVSVPREVRWRGRAPTRIAGLILANEWLDNIPVDVAELSPDGPRLVLVDPATGAERLGGHLQPEDEAWLARWWPLRHIGDRAEIGHPRCTAWASLIARLERGAAVAADYTHSAGARPATGTLTGYRDGHLVPAVPDGSCDLTAHVALDACAASGACAGAASTLLTTQRRALRALGVSGQRPPLALARSDPRRYACELWEAAQEGELIDPDGFGAFGWLVQTTAGVRLPIAFAETGPPG
jgi:SAM-dependent MidA family methyltransferase